MSAQKNEEILLESGTNEIEIMEFTIAGNTFGINVAKIREIMNASEIKKIPYVHPAIEGVFKPRDLVITLINLPSYLGMEEEHDISKDLFIITNFNKMHIAFRVDTVEGIDRISWADIEKPDDVIYGGEEGIVTMLAKFEGRLITILDFEKIVADIAPKTGIQMEDIDDLVDRPNNEKPVMIVEDSAMLSAMLVQALQKAGYTHIIKKDNGEEAWEHLEELKAKHGDDLNGLHEDLCLIITDIEMPKMDGHRLTKLVKEDDLLKNLPLVIFSSLVNDEMRRKGKALGADEQLSKPEIRSLVEVVDRLIDEYKPAN